MWRKLTTALVMALGLGLATGGVAFGEDWSEFLEPPGSRGPSHAAPAGKQAQPAKRGKVAKRGKAKKAKRRAAARKGSRRR